jgi:hypothetical protein
MMVRNRALVLAVLVGLVVTSCDDFFSTSWGPSQEYDISKIKLEQGNLDQWKKKAVGNPDLAKKLVEKIIGELSGKSGAEKAAFQEAGIELAIEQSGMGTKILEVASSDLSNIDSEAGVKDLLQKVQSDLDGNTTEAANNIATIASANSLLKTKAGQAPKFPRDDPYASTADASNVGLAVMVLALAVAPEIDTSKDLASQIPHLSVDTESEPRAVTVTARASPTEIVLAAYLNLIASDTTSRFDDNVITSGIKSAFIGG